MYAKLPSTLATYLSAQNKHDVDSMISLFAENAIVKDEGQEYRGQSAILDWMKGTIKKYDFQAEPTGVSQEGDRTVVTAILSGTFPGSPVTLGYRFKLDGQKITHLEIG